MIKNNLDATIKDYMKIVEQDELSETQLTAAKSVAVVIPVREEYEPPVGKLPSVALAESRKKPKERTRTKYERKWTF